MVGPHAMIFKISYLFLLMCDIALASNTPSASSVFISGGALNTATPSINLPVTTTALSTRVGLITGSTAATSGQQHFSFSSTTQTGTGCYTSTNTLYCTGATISASAANIPYSFGYGTNCVYNSGAPAGAQYYSQGSTNYLFNNLNATANVPATVPVFVRFPAGKIPFVVGTWGVSESFSIMLDCVEL